MTENINETVEVKKKKNNTTIYLIGGIVLFSLTVLSVSDGWRYFLKNILELEEHSRIYVNSFIIFILLVEYIKNKNETNKITYFNAFPYAALLIIFLGFIFSIWSSLLNIIHVGVLSFIIVSLIKVQWGNFKEIMEEQNKEDLLSIK